MTKTTRQNMSNRDYRRVVSEARHPGSKARGFWGRCNCFWCSGQRELKERTSRERDALKYEINANHD